MWWENARLSFYFRNSTGVTAPAVDEQLKSFDTSPSHFIVTSRRQGASDSLLHATIHYSAHSGVLFMAFIH